MMRKKHQYQTYACYTTTQAKKEKSTLCVVTHVDHHYQHPVARAVTLLTDTSPQTTLGFHETHSWGCIGSVEKHTITHCFTKGTHLEKWTTWYFWCCVNI